MGSPGWRGNNNRLGETGSQVFVPSPRSDLSDLSPARRTVIAACQWLATKHTPGTQRKYADAIGLPYYAWHTGLCDLLREQAREHRLDGRCAQPSARTTTASVTWFMWCLDHGLDPTSPDVGYSGRIHHWVKDMREHGAGARYQRLGPDARHLRFSAVGSFYRHAVGQGHAATDPTAGVDRATARLGGINPDVIRTPALSFDELAMLLWAADHYRGAGAFYTARASAMIAVLLATGCRTEEVVGLDSNHYRRHGVTGVVELHRKGGRLDLLTMHTWAADRLDRYLHVRPDVHAWPPPANVVLPLFVTLPTSWHQVMGLTDRRISGDEFRDTLQRVALGSGLPSLVRRAENGGITPRMIRASVFTHLLDADEPVVNVQRLAGHSSPATTTRYYDLEAHARGGAAAMTNGRMLGSRLDSIGARIAAGEVA